MPRYEAKLSAGTKLPELGKETDTGLPLLAPLQSVCEDSKQHMPLPFFLLDAH